MNKSQHLIEHVVTRSSALLPRRIEYVPVVEYVDRPVPAQAELTNSELVHALWTNMVWKQLVPSLWELVAIDFIYIAVITAAIIISVVTICRCTRGRPIQTTPNWLIQIFNNTKGRDHAKGDSSSRRGESCGGPSAGHSTHEESDPVQHAIEPDIKLENYRPGEDFNEWIHLFEEHAAKYAKQRWAALLYTNLDKQCHQHGKFSSREGYEQLREKLESAFGEVETPDEAVNCLFDATDALDKLQSRQRKDNESAIEFLAVLEKLADAALQSMSKSEKEKHIKARFLNGLNNHKLREEIVRAIINHEDLFKPGQSGYEITLEKLKPIIKKFERLLPHLSSSDESDTSSRHSARSWQGHKHKKTKEKRPASLPDKQEPRDKVEDFIDNLPLWTLPATQKQHQQYQQQQQQLAVNNNNNRPQANKFNRNYNSDNRNRYNQPQQQQQQQVIKHIYCDGYRFKKRILGRFLVEHKKLIYELVHDGEKP